MQAVIYEQAVQNFMAKLELNRTRAEQKKQEYLQRILQIFRDFVSKSENQINKIIENKLQKLQKNYVQVLEYFQKEKYISYEEKGLIVTEFLIKPFQKFPFSGSKNEKIFRQQYNLIQKASFLIEQTLVDSFNEDQVPNFSNQKFFETIQNYGLGQQSLTKLSICPQNLSLQPLEDIIPIQKNIMSLKVMGEYVILTGDDLFIQIWDIQDRVCVKKLYIEIIASINCLGLLMIQDLKCLAIGFGDQDPEIWIYRTDNWNRYGCNRSHTRGVTKLLQIQQFLISGSIDGNVCIHSLNPFKHMHSSPHISSIQDLVVKNNLIYVLMKCSSVCQYQLQTQQGDAFLQFRRTLSTGFISMIRYTQVGSNFSGVSCHIYGLSQIQITRKCRIEETSIINIPQMIADFVILQSKLTSEYFAICGFQNSSAVRIYSLRSGEAIYEIAGDYLGEVGVAGYLPKVQICCVNGEYRILLINQSQFDSGNSVRVYRLRI